MDTYWFPMKWFMNWCFLIICSCPLKIFFWGLPRWSPLHVGWWIFLGSSTLVTTSRGLMGCTHFAWGCWFFLLFLQFKRPSLELVYFRISSLELFYEWSRFCGGVPGVLLQQLWLTGWEECHFWCQPLDQWKCC